MNWSTFNLWIGLDFLDQTFPRLVLSTLFTEDKSLKRLGQEIPTQSKDMKGSGSTEAAQNIALVVRQILPLTYKHA